MQDIAHGCIADLVYDVGAHNGEDSDFYLRLGYRVVAIEANPHLAADLRGRFATQQAQGRFTLVEGAVSPKPGLVPFYVNEHSTGWSTADPEWAARNASTGAPSREIAVEAISFPAVLREHGIPYYLKLDIEGADRLCLEAVETFDQRPGYISLEASTDDWEALRGEMQLLARLGYSRFKIVRQGRHRNGRFTDRVGGRFAASFDVHSSGPFGGDLAGPWLTREQALLRYRLICLLSYFLSDRSPIGRTLFGLRLLRRLRSALPWYDTHAGR